MKAIQNQYQSKNLIIGVIVLAVIGVGYMLQQGSFSSVLNIENIDPNARAINGQPAAAPMPNLVINSVKWKDVYTGVYGNAQVHNSTFLPYDTYTYFRVVVRNKGNKVAVLNTSTNLNIYIGPVSNGAFVANMMPGANVSIPPGTNHTFFFSSFGNGQNPLKSSTGTFSLTAVVDDITNTVLESNESDNSKSFSVTVI